jgi:ribosomal protein S14
MLHSKTKNIKLREKFAVFEYEILVKKFLFINLMSKINENYRKFLVFFIKNFKNYKFSKVLIKKKCVLTFRSKGVSRPFKISRSKLKELMSFGIIPGYTKAVW